MLRRISPSATSKHLGLATKPRLIHRLSTCAALTALATLRAPTPVPSGQTLTCPRSFATTSSLSNLNHFHHRSMATASSSTSNGVDPFAAVEVQWPFVNGSNVLQNVLPGYEVVPATDNTPAYAVFNQPIQKSLNDDREYRYVGSRGR
jgi:hypothetical protein